MIAEAAAGEDGRFRSAEIQSGTYRLRITPKGAGGSLLKEVKLAEGQTLDLGDIEIPAGAVIRGRIYWKASGEAIVGETIQIWSAGGFRREVRSDANGQYEFAELTNGIYYGLQIEKFKINSGGDIQLKPAEIKEMDFAIGAATLKVRALKAGKPCAASISLSCESNTAARHSGGGGETEAEFNGLTQGRYRIYAQDRNYQCAARQYVEVPALGQVDAEISLPAGRLVGRVLDSEGKPVKNARVKAIFPPGFEGPQKDFTLSAETGLDGAFVIEDLPGGVVSVLGGTAELGYRTVQNINVPTDGESAPVEIRLGGSESGTLVSICGALPEGKPLAAAWCKLLGEAASLSPAGAERGEDGVLRLGGIPPGTYEVEVSAWGYSREQHTVEIKAGETTTIEDVLYPAGALRWTLNDKSGKPLMGIACALKPNDPASIEDDREGQTDKSGQFVVRGLAPGDYTATASPEGAQPITKTFTIKAADLTQETSVLGF